MVAKRVGAPSGDPGDHLVPWWLRVGTLSESLVNVPDHSSVWRITMAAVLAATVMRGGGHKMNWWLPQKKVAAAIKSSCGGR